MPEIFEHYLKAFIMILVIMDPFGGVPIFMMLTRDDTVQKMRRSANRATKVAAILIVLFLFLGKLILDFFSISIESFKIAGGIILFLVGLTYVLDIEFGKTDQKQYDRDITIPMATPLIAGPGVITAVIISVQEYGLITSLAAVVINLFIFWILMRYSHKLHSIMGNQGSEILSRVMGLILTAMAIEFIITGITSFLA